MPLPKLGRNFGAFVEAREDFSRSNVFNKPAGVRPEGKKIIADSIGLHLDEQALWNGVLTKDVGLLVETKLLAEALTITRREAVAQKYAAVADPDTRNQDPIQDDATAVLAQFAQLELLKGKAAKASAIDNKTATALITDNMAINKKLSTIADKQAEALPRFNKLREKHSWFGFRERKFRLQERNFGAVLAGYAEQAHRLIAKRQENLDKLGLFDKREQFNNEVAQLTNALSSQGLIGPGVKEQMTQIANNNRYLGFDATDAIHVQPRAPYDHVRSVLKSLKTPEHIAKLEGDARAFLQHAGDITKQDLVRDTIVEQVEKRLGSQKDRYFTYVGNVWAPGAPRRGEPLPSIDASESAGHQYDTFAQAPRVKNRIIDAGQIVEEQLLDYLSAVPLDKLAAAVDEALENTIDQLRVGQPRQQRASVHSNDSYGRDALEESDI